jgi:hypothetical protein
MWKIGGIKNKKNIWDKTMCGILYYKPLGK